MIPDIGLMIAAYIITRMARIVAQTNPREHGVVIAFAVITIGVTVLMGADLVLRGGIGLPAGLTSSDTAGARPTEMAINPTSPLIGLTKEQVRAKLGKPESELRRGNTWIYGNTQVHFENERVEEVIEPR